MSDNIPFEIQVEIMKRLPVRPLIQFRTVSKAWKSLVDSSDFITHYGSQLQHLLVSYIDAVDLERKYVSIVDDDTFPQQKVSVAVPLLIDLFQYYRIIGISHGLLCLYEHYGLVKNLAVLWNPSLRKAVGVVVPNVGGGIYDTVLGFGVWGETRDPKIVKITYIDNWTEMENIPDDMPDSIPWQVEVFTLSTGVWRSPYSNLPRKPIQYNGSQVVDGFLYWLAMDWSSTEGLIACNLIISFDLISEEFKEVNLPCSLANDTYQEDLYISKLRKSLAVLEHDEKEMIFVVWIMEDGVQSLFTKLFTICTPDKTILRRVEFRKSGEPVIEYVDSRQLVVYDTYSKHFNNLEINGRGSYSVYAYMETLLLFDQPEFSIYNKGKHYIKMLEHSRANNRRPLKHTQKV